MCHLIYLERGFTSYWDWSFNQVLVDMATPELLVAAVRAG